MALPLHLVTDKQLHPIDSAADLYEYIADGAKPKSEWRLGTEIELVGVSTDKADFGAVPPYDGSGGIGAILESLESSTGGEKSATGKELANTDPGMGAGAWTGVREAGKVIALVQGDAQITIEPGGQLELASRPVRSVRDTEADFARFAEQLREPSRTGQIAWLGVGFRPFGSANDVSWMPKGRYEVMRAYLPTRGRLAHEMMKRTATVQTNIDYQDADDAKRKLRCAMSVTSLMTAIYANSPIVDETLTDWQSYRSSVWYETDPDRCGLLPFVFDDGDIFEMYTHWALDVPMFFVYRDRYLPADGMTFRRFMEQGFGEHRATIDDWALHLSTLFPEARMKRLIEIRGCDAGSVAMAVALGALCRGLFYDSAACQEASQLTKGLEFSQRITLWQAVAQRGFMARVPGRRIDVGALCRELVAIADDGLGREAPFERTYLDPLKEIVEDGRTQADHLADEWRRSNGDRRAMVDCLAHPGLGVQ